MSQLTISRSLLALLLLSSVLTIIVVLRPSATDTANAADLLPERRPRALLQPGQDQSAPWQRPMVADAVISRVRGGLMPVSPPPPPVIRPTLVVAEPIVFQPPTPVVPTPRFRYLGRLESDDESRVFVALGDAFESIPVGGVVDGNWRINRITDEGVELEYLPLRETRWLSVVR